MENLKELFEETIKDLYNAEKQFLKAMPKLMKAAQSPELKQAIESHITQSEGQVQRLEKVAEMGGFKPTGKVCKAAQGLVEEANEHLEEGKPGATLDAAIISCAQKNEHYEICSYGTVIAWAEAIGNEEAVSLLQESLQEEIDTDDLLSDLSEAINVEAANGSESSERSTKGTGKSGKNGSSDDKDESTMENESQSKQGSDSKSGSKTGATSKSTSK